MSFNNLSGVLKTVLPGAPKIVDSSLSAADATANGVDFLFLCRSEKKRKYFSRVAAEALGDYRCMIASYHNLPPARGRALSAERLQDLLTLADQELFSAREGHWMMHLRPLLRWLRTKQIRSIHAQLSALLDDVAPRAIVVWNGRKFQDHVLHAVNERRIPIVYFENGVLPASTTVDPRGINADISAPRDPSIYRSSETQHINIRPINDRLPRQGLLKKTSAKMSPADVGNGLNILLPFQKERDTQILEHSPWIHSMPALFKVVTEAIRSAQVGSYRLWLREHPSSATRYPSINREAAASSDCSFANGGKLADWLDTMDLVITINSSVGMEALIKGKKVITLGHAFYNIPGLVEHAESTEQLTQAIHRILTTPVDEQLRLGFIAYLANHYVVSGDWRKPDSQHWLDIKKRMVPALASQQSSAVAIELKVS
jgi:capsular polysaccharide export protein